MGLPQNLEDFLHRIFLAIWFIICVLFGLSLWGVYFARAEEPRLCRAPYALLSPNFKYDQYREHTRDVGLYEVAVLWNTFGNKFENLKRELLRPNVIGVELILFNTVCVRNGNCGTYETLSGYSVQSLERAISEDRAAVKGKIRAEAQNAASALRPLLSANQRCFINPFLEHNLTRQSWAKAVGWISDLYPNCKFVWNPQGTAPGAPQLPASISEGHGDKPKFVGPRCIANPDGTVIDAGEYPSYLAEYGQRCELACAWMPNDNCRTEGGPFIDPRRRTCAETKDFPIMAAAMKKARKIAAPVPPWTPKDDLAFIGCDRRLPPHDGYKKGFLAKESHVDVYGWTVLFPRELGRMESVETYKEAKPVHKWKYYYQYVSDGSNRAIWRAEYGPGRPVKPDQFPYNIVIRGKSRGKIYCWRIENPPLRYD